MTLQTQQSQNVQTYDWNRNRIRKWFISFLSVAKVGSNRNKIEIEISLLGFENIHKQYFFLHFIENLV